MANPPVVTEVQRKLFHSLMVLVAIVNWIGVFYLGPRYGPLLSIGFTGIVLIVFLVFDLVRIRVYGYFPFRRITDRVIRPVERTRLGASVYFAVGTLFTFLLLHIISIALLDTYQLELPWMLSGWLAAGAVIVAALGDGAAAIIGMRFGRRRIRKNKTVEGTLGGFIIGFLSFLPLWFFIGVPLIYGFIAAIMLVIVDLVALPIDDNLLNPVALGFTLASVEFFTILLISLGVS